MSLLPKHLRDQTDLELVRRAKVGDKLALNQLIKNHRDLLELKARYAGGRAPIPLPAVEGEAMRIVALAVTRYDPTSNASFRTFLDAHLRGLNRYVQSNKRVDRVPEHRQLQIQRFQSVKSLLQTERGREPTTQELVEALGWSQSDVMEMDKVLQQRSLAASGLYNVRQQTSAFSRYNESAELLYVTWTPQEQLVYDYSLGAHGKPQIASVEQIASKTGMTADRVYKLKRKLTKDIASNI
jgi:DNA-directed RNA polymerase sigma subunit (sigma70/sigma32)